MTNSTSTSTDIPTGFVPPALLRSAIGHSRSDSWHRYCQTEPAPPPARLTPARLSALGPDERFDYDQARSEHHQNLGPYLHPALQVVVNHTINRVNKNNQRRTTGAAPSVVLSGPPNIGKTTVLREIGRQIELSRRRSIDFGYRTSDGDLYVPVVFIEAEDNMGAKAFYNKILRFLNAPKPRTNVTAWELEEAAKEHITRCGVDTLIVDEIHLLSGANRGHDPNTYLKSLTNQTGITVVGAGINVTDAPFLRPSVGRVEGAHEQTRNRFHLYNIEPFDITAQDGADAWYTLLADIENDLVLAHSPTGSLTTHWDLLWTRTSGSLGALFALIKDVVDAAISSGNETITKQLISRARVSIGAADQEPVAQRRLRTSTHPPRR